MSVRQNQKNIYLKGGIIPSMKTPITVVTCIDCGTKYNVAYSTYNAVKRANPNNPKFRCPACTIKYRAQKMKERMKNMSPEEKAIMYKKAGEKHSKTLSKLSEEEKAARMARVNAGRDEWIKNETDEERQRISEIHSESNRRRWKSKSEEEKQRDRDAAKERWINASSEFKKQHAQNSIDMWKNKSEEERNKTISKMSESRKELWNSMSEDKLKELSDKISATLTQYFASLSEEQKKVMSDRSKEYYESLSDEEKLKISERCSNNNKERWDNATEEEKMRQSEYLVEGRKKWYNSLSDEEKEYYANLRAKNLSNWWQSMPDEEKEKLIEERKEAYYNLPLEERIRRVRNALSNANGDNQFHKKFEKYFAESHLSSRFYYIREFATSNEELHYWDYGIFDMDKKLVAVVDLDGAYFHAGNCDYDGIHSKEEYDERRCLCVPDGVKICIILELDFTKSFENLIKTLMMNYDEYVESIFKENA